MANKAGVKLKLEDADWVFLNRIRSTPDVSEKLKKLLLQQIEQNSNSLISDATAEDFQLYQGAIQAFKGLLGALENSGNVSQKIYEKQQKENRK